MTDKLYSRPKIRLPNIRKAHPAKLFLLILFLTIILAIAIFLRTAYPVFKGSCETTATSKGNKIITSEVNKVMQNYTYNDLINMEKDGTGKITLIEANTILINDIVTQIVGNIQKEFDNIPRITVDVNLGTVSGISVLKRIDPKFQIQMESSGNIKSSIRTEFKSVGINQTHHKIYLGLNSRVSILTPINAFSSNIDTEVLLTEAVIVGEVPATYYNINGLEEVEDTFNFIE